jgi:hypothetical protein
VIVIPKNIIDKAPSAELRPNQTDQDSLPPYPVLDDILECLVEKEMGTEEIVARGHDEATVHRIEHLLYIAEYKRRQSAPGVKITKKNLAATGAIRSPTGSATAKETTSCAVRWKSIRLPTVKPALSGRRNSWSRLRTGRQMASHW